MTTRLGRMLFVASVALVGCGGAGPDSSATSASPTAAATIDPFESAPRLADRLEAEIDVPGSPDWPISAFGSIWVLAPDLPIHAGGGTPNLVRIDPASNRVVATVALTDRLCQGFAASEKAIWACTNDGLVRIDPATDTITGSLAVEGISRSIYQPAVGGGGVWFLGSTASVADTVIRFDPETEAVTTFRQPARILGLAYGFDALWLTLGPAGSVVRLDPATGESRMLVDGLPVPAAIAVGADSLWVALRGDPEAMARPGETQLARLDPSTGDILAELEIGGSPQGGVNVWAGAGGVLVRSTRPWLVRIDEATNQVTDAVVADLQAQGPLAFDFGSIWTVNAERDVVYRIRP